MAITSCLIWESSPDLLVTPKKPVVEGSVIMKTFQSRKRDNERQNIKTSNPFRHVQPVIFLSDTLIAVRNLKKRWITLSALMLASAGATVGFSAQQPAASASDINHYIWDLSSLYPNLQAWEAERALIIKKIGTVGHLQGTVGQSPKNLADALDEISDLRARASKIAIFGLLASQLDVRSEVAQTQYNVATALEPQVEAAVAFVADEVLQLGKARMDQWLQQEPRLIKYRIRINRIMQEAPHTLRAEEQALVASMAGWPRVSADAFWALHDSDLGWPKLKNADGKEVSVNLYTYATQFQGAEQAKALEAFLGKLRPLENCFGLLYTRRIEADLTIARSRKFSNGIDAIWFLRDGMPEGSHRIMIDVARENLPAAHRYFKLRARAVLGLDHFDYKDFYTLPSGINRHFAIADAIDIAIGASAPLGAAYQQRLRERMEAKWMHLPPWPEKRGVFGIYPPVGGANPSNPYFLMSYQPNYRSSRAFAGGVTLMMSFGDIPRDRLSETRDDSGIYANAVIFVGNMLHDDYLLRQTTNRDEQIAYLVHALDLIWRQYFRWTILSELDVRVQQLIIDGKTPSGRQISQIYLELLHEYVGNQPNQGSVDDVFGAEWMAFSVPFLSYEHQFWPAGMAAAADVVEGLRAGNENARKAVDEVLGRGDNDRTYQLLRQVGIDMATSEPYKALIRRMNHELDELENLLNHKG